MAPLPWLVRKSPGTSTNVAEADATSKSPPESQKLRKAQVAYLEGLWRLRAMRLDPDLERAAADDLGRSYRAQFGDDELRRLRNLVYEDGCATSEPNLARQSIRSKVFRRPTHHCENADLGDNDDSPQSATKPEGDPGN